MKVDKDLMLLMRHGKQAYRYYNVKKQNDAGIYVISSIFLGQILILTLFLINGG